MLAFSGGGRIDLSSSWSQGKYFFFKVNFLLCPLLPLLMATHSSRSIQASVVSISHRWVLIFVFKTEIYWHRIYLEIKPRSKALSVCWPVLYRADGNFLSGPWSPLDDTVLFFIWLDKVLSVLHQTGMSLSYSSICEKSPWFLSELYHAILQVVLIQATLYSQLLDLHICSWSIFCVLTSIFHFFSQHHTQTAMTGSMCCMLVLPVNPHPTSPLLVQPCWLHVREAWNTICPRSPSIWFCCFQNPVFNLTK